MTVNCSNARKLLSNVSSYEDTIEPFDRTTSYSLFAWCFSIYMIEQWPTKRHNIGMQTSPNATKRVRLAAAYTVAAQAVLSEPNTGTTEQDHYEAFKVFLNWKHVRQKRAATVIQRFYRRRRLREEFKLINVSRHQINNR